MKSHLKVKVFSLSAEMTYIRRQEEKWKTRARIARQRQKPLSQGYAEANFWSHRGHRHGLKFEARNTHLAFGCIKGIPYSKMEPLCYGVFKGYGSTEPDWKAIEAMVERFTKDETNPQNFMQAFAEWLADAQKWYEGNKLRIPAAHEARVAERIRRANDPAYQQAKLERHMTAMDLGKKAAKPDNGGLEAKIGEVYTG
jgi:hypothetical protein